MKILYAKYNRERLPEYQIETTIFRENCDIIVRKKALSFEAKKHVKAIYYNYIKLIRLSNKKHVPSRLLNGHIYFDYVEGKSYELIVLGSLMAGDKCYFFEHLDKYIEFINSDALFTEKYASSYQFTQIFNISLVLDNVYVHNVANIDMTFDNIISNRNELVIIDYEWVFNFAVPADYIIYRSIRKFHCKHYHRIKYIIDLSEIWQYLKYDQKTIEIFEMMEGNFQAFVLGTSKQYIINKAYLKNKLSLIKNSIDATDSALELINNGSRAAVICAVNDVAEKENNFSAEHVTDRHIKTVRNLLLDLGYILSLLLKKIADRFMRILHKHNNYYE